MKFINYCFFFYNLTRYKYSLGLFYPSLKGLNLKPCSIDEFCNNQCIVIESYHGSSSEDKSSGTSSSNALNGLLNQYASDGDSDDEKANKYESDSNGSSANKRRKIYLGENKLGAMFFFINYAYFLQRLIATYIIVFLQQTLKTALIQYRQIF